MITISPAAARHAIAAAYLAGDGTEEATPLKRIGSIDLRPHQVDAIERIGAAIREFGGALLCDPVGTGKTFTALAVASRYGHVLVIAPAVLAVMWSRASSRAGVTMTFISHESLSRGKTVNGHFDLVIVDEAHHVRNPATRRFEAVSRIAATSDLLLLSATPIHNRRADLDAVLSLFMGSRASALSDAELARCMLRRDAVLAVDQLGIPRVDPIVWVDIPHDSEIVARLLALPPPLPLREAGDGGALIVCSLVRQWASSDAALLAGLRRRRNRAIALIAALEAGAYPSPSELAAWTSSNDSVQLAFASLVASPHENSARLLPAILAHHDAVCRIIDRLKSRSERDDARATAIATIRERHTPVPVVAFSQYADTVSGMFRRLVGDGHVALLTGQGALVAGGRISRAEAIGRFAPRASGRSPVTRRDLVTLLLTTDILSEGVNLQDAGTVIHLDLPWTPARMEQRLGRIARMGSNHVRVHSYALRPPASAESVARIESVLEAKMRAASALTGDLPALNGFRAAHDGEPGRTAFVEEIRRRLNAWIDPGPGEPRKTPHGVAAVRATEAGFLAACLRNDRPLLICSIDDRISETLRDIDRCVRLVDESRCEAMVSDCSSAISALEQHLAVSAALADIPAALATSRTRMFARIASVAARARPHARARMAHCADLARNVVGRQLGAYQEAELEELASLDLPDDAWLDQLIERFGGDVTIRRDTTPTQVIAMIVLVPHR